MDRAFELLALVASSYAAACLQLLSGSLQPTTLIAGLGVLFGVAGLALAVVRRERRAIRFVAPLLFALLLPAIIFFFNLMVRRVGIWFGGIGGVVLLLIWVAVLANDTRHRLPAWLLGLAILCYGAFAWLVMLALDGG